MSKNWFSTTGWTELHTLHLSIVDFGMNWTYRHLGAEEFLDCPGPHVNTGTAPQRLTLAFMLNVYN